MDLKCYLAILSFAIPLAVTLSVSLVTYLVVGLGVTDAVLLVTSSIVFSVISGVLAYAAITLGASTCR